MIPSLVIKRDPLARPVSETETPNSRFIVFTAVLVNAQGESPAFSLEEHEFHDLALNHPPAMVSRLHPGLLKAHSPALLLN
jgi:hypothetical protein